MSKSSERITEKRTVITSSSSNYDDGDDSIYYKSGIQPRSSTVVNRSSIGPSMRASVGGGSGGTVYTRTVEYGMGRSSGLGNLSPGSYEKVSNTGVMTVKSSREKEKKDMQDLNERFANYIEKVRFLEAQNRKLAGELEHLKTKWGKETSAIKSMYEQELAEARKLIDDLTRDKNKLEIQNSSLQEEMNGLRRQMDDLKKYHALDQEQINKLNQQLSDYESEINMLRRTISSLETERARDKDRINKLQGEVDRLRIDLNNETLNHLDAENRRQTLEEEMEFLKKVHEQELKELAALAYRDTTEENREFWKSELSQAIRDIQNEYDNKVDQIRGDMESYYNLKVQEFRTGATKQNMEVTHVKEENKKLVKSISDLKGRLADLEARNAQLEAQYNSLLREYESMQSEHTMETVKLKEEITNLRAEMEAILVELQSLMDAKLSLELEIAAYRKLLESEESRVDRLRRLGINIRNIRSPFRSPPVETKADFEFNSGVIVDDEQTERDITPDDDASGGNHTLASNTLDAKLKDLQSKTSQHHDAIEDKNDQSHGIEKSPTVQVSSIEITTKESDSVGVILSTDKSESVTSPDHADAKRKPSEIQEGMVEEIVSKIECTKTESQIKSEDVVEQEARVVTPEPTDKVTIDDGYGKSDDKTTNNAVVDISDRQEVTEINIGVKEGDRSESKPSPIGSPDETSNTDNQVDELKSVADKDSIVDSTPLNADIETKTEGSVLATSQNTNDGIAADEDSTASKEVTKNEEKQTTDTVQKTNENKESTRTEGEDESHVISDSAISDDIGKDCPTPDSPTSQKQEPSRTEQQSKDTDDLNSEVSPSPGKDEIQDSTPESLKHEPSIAEQRSESSYDLKAETDVQSDGSKFLNGKTPSPTKAESTTELSNPNELDENQDTRVAESDPSEKTGVDQGSQEEEQTRTSSSPTEKTVTNVDSNKDDVSVILPSSESKHQINGQDSLSTDKTNIDEDNTENKTSSVRMEDDNINTKDISTDDLHPEALLKQISENDSSTAANKSPEKEHILNKTEPEQETGHEKQEQVIESDEQVTKHDKQEIEEVKVTNGYTDEQSVTINGDAADINEDNVVDEDSHSSMKMMRGEVSAKTTYQKTSTGPVSIAEVNPEGKFITLENTSSQRREVNLDGWKIRRELDGQREVVYTFRNFTLKPHKSVKIFARGSAQEAGINDLVFRDEETWGVGSQVSTCLVNEKGEEKATHRQRTAYN